MAAAFFNAAVDPHQAEPVSAGTQRVERVHPEVVAVMREVGTDLSAARPQKPTEELAPGAQTLVSMGCGDACPYVPGRVRDDWALQAPKGQPLTRVHEIREDVHQRDSPVNSDRGVGAFVSAR